ncbi:hypothetical protein [Plantactinospora sonchi]|uniref:Uncharacterized protein n=1 Tax=Plantactinospora sonchi TaxID=1544735 RepID=A0ABU7RXA8_9ACTN
MPGLGLWVRADLARCRAATVALTRFCGRTIGPVRMPARTIGLVRLHGDTVGPVRLRAHGHAISLPAHAIGRVRLHGHGHAIGLVRFHGHTVGPVRLHGHAIGLVGRRTGIPDGCLVGARHERLPGRFRVSRVGCHALGHQVGRRRESLRVSGRGGRRRLHRRLLRLPGRYVPGRVRPQCTIGWRRRRLVRLGKLFVSGFGQRGAHRRRWRQRGQIAATAGTTAGRGRAGADRTVRVRRCVPGVRLCL